MRDQEHVWVMLGGRMEFVEGGRPERKISYMGDSIFMDWSIYGPFMDFIALFSGLVVL